MGHKKQRNIGKKKNVTKINRESVWLETKDKYGKPKFEQTFGFVNKFVERK